MGFRSLGFKGLGSGFGVYGSGFRDFFALSSSEVCHTRPNTPGERQAHELPLIIRVKGLGVFQISNGHESLFGNITGHQKNGKEHGQLHRNWDCIAIGVNASAN